MKRYIGLTLLLLLTVMCTNSYAVQITVGSGSAQPGQSVGLPVMVDTPGEIAGAAFTLTYDKSKLTLTSITSSFFDTFTNQWNSLIPVPSPLPPVTVDVGGITYNQPLVKNDVSGGMCIAAARCKAGASSPTLFNLTFTVGASVAAGPLTVNIVPTVLTNIDAGYTAPTEIPILVGAVDSQPDLTQAYPVLTSTIVSGTLTVLAPGIVDTDGDGIDDNWEMTHFGNLTTANATSDYDKDGWTDKEEYKNGTDPKIPNAKPGIEAFAADFGAPYGLFFYSNDNWINIIPMSPKEMLYFDIDNDGTKELVASFDGLGLFYFKADGWHEISPYVPKSMILCGNQLALDFQNLGIFLYPWAQLLPDYSADRMVAVDTNLDGIAELYVSFQKYGLFKYDQVSSTWTSLLPIVPEQMIPAGNKLLCDYGTQYGLYLYDQNGWFSLVPGLKPAVIHVADIDKDGKPEIILGYKDIGLFSYNTTSGSWTMLNYAVPEAIISHLDGIACDYGSAYGLWFYSHDTDWKQLVPVDASMMISTDVFSSGTADIVGVFPTYGTWLRNEIAQTWTQISPFDIKNIVPRK